MFPTSKPGIAGAGAGGGKRGSDLKFIRHVPKFLQGHAHLLGSRNTDAPAGEELAAKRGAPPREGDDSDDDAEAERQVCRRPVLCLPLCTTSCPLS